MKAEIHFPLWVDYADDPKFIAAGEKAEVLFIRAGCLMKRTKSDGQIHDIQLDRLGLSGVRARAQRLVEVGLWEQTEDGYFCPSFLKRNKSRAQIEELAAKRAEAGSKGGRPAKPNGNQVGLASENQTESKPETQDKTRQVKSSQVIREAPAEPSLAPTNGSRTNGTKGTRIPAEFEVTQSMQQWVREKCPGLNWDRETIKFVNYFTAASGSKAVKVDWPAAWRNWMLSAVDFGSVR